MLSKLIGRDVVGRDGRRIGSLADLSASLGNSPGRHLINAMSVRRRAMPDLLLPFGAVESFSQGSIRLGQDDLDRFAVPSVADALADDEIMLVRDVLDTQIVDVAGQRLARVADVVLARTNDKKLELVGVEVGFAAVLRRLGLERLTAGARQNAVAWTDLHLMSERGHAVQLASPRSAVHHLDARGLAELVRRVDTESAAEILAAREPAVAAEAVTASHPVVGERVLRAMPETELAHIVAAMPAQHATHWRGRLARQPPLRGRRFIRSRAFSRSHDNHSDKTAHGDKR